MNQVKRVRCGIPDCDWFVASLYLALSPKAVADSYELFFDHLVAEHGLDPETREMPEDVESAAFHIDLEHGSLTVRITASEPGYRMELG